MKHSHWPQRLTLHDWSRAVRCWGETKRISHPFVKMTKKEYMTTLGKVWEAILGQNGVCLSCTAKEASNSSTEIHNMYTNQLGTNLTEVQTLSEPSDTCWVQSLQRMPQPAPPPPKWSCFHDGVDLSNTKVQQHFHSQVIDYTMESRLPGKYWSNIDRINHHIYTEYIYIS